MIDKLDPIAVSCQRRKTRQRDANVARSSLSFVGLGDDPFGTEQLHVLLNYYLSLLLTLFNVKMFCNKLLALLDQWKSLTVNSFYFQLHSFF